MQRDEAEDWLNKAIASGLWIPNHSDEDGSNDISGDNISESNQ